MVLDIPYTIFRIILERYIKENVDKQDVDVREGKVDEGGDMGWRRARMLMRMI